MAKITKDNKRVIIENVYPEINNGRFPAKRIVGEKVEVSADIFAEGHDEVLAALLFKRKGEKKWRETLMTKGLNDDWQGNFTIEDEEDYLYTLQGWVDEFGTWRKKIMKIYQANQDMTVELMVGAAMLKQAALHAKGRDQKSLVSWAEKLTDGKDVFNAAQLALSDELFALVRKYGKRKFVTLYELELRVQVDRQRALFSSWYELFPRSWAAKSGKHGTFKDCQKILPEIARMGFDVVYLPPIHPIGTTKRKGKNNATLGDTDSVGSPWAIGNKEGGHKAIHPELGTLDDFKSFVKEARRLKLEVAIDIAFQCSPDHPYVKEHPSWFKWRPDKTIQYAENPPKKYEDVYPINFDTEDYEALWEELKSVFIFWIEQGVEIFRVDNPHTKPFGFWDWLLGEIRREHPQVLFLSESFTRPKVMQRLAKGGFHQSYTYFTWRTSNWDFIQYLKELTKTEVKEYFRPNFWPNTPDILPFHLQHADRPAFMTRLILAATLSSSYGIYGPAFELCVNQPVDGKEEYDQSEKYEIKQWNWDQQGNLKDFITTVNKIRRENPALQETNNIEFFPSNNDQLLCFQKKTADKENIILVIINLDSQNTQSGWVSLPLDDLGLDQYNSFKVHDLLSKDTFWWQGEFNFVRLNPFESPAHILKIPKEPL